MNLEELYFMLDEKDENENPFITPELTRAYHTMDGELYTLLNNAALKDTDINELLENIRSTLITIIDMEKKNSFIIGYKTALNLVLIK